MGMGPSRPSTMTPMFSTCPCTAMTMATSSQEVEHQMRYVECVELGEHLEEQAILEPDTTATSRAGQVQTLFLPLHTCYSSGCPARKC